MWDPAVVAWSVKALVFHSVNSSPEQAVDRIPSSMVYQLFRGGKPLVANS